jgi:hypothetical protein
MIRIGLSETELFASGYEAIFRGRRSPAKKAAHAKKKAVTKNNASSASKRKVKRKKR